MTSITEHGTVSVRGAMVRLDFASEAVLRNGHSIIPSSSVFFQFPKGTRFVTGWRVSPRPDWLARTMEDGSMESRPYVRVRVPLHGTSSCRAPPVALRIVCPIVYNKKRREGV
jgi:hypothetical protein